jgi:predicted MPP superfamily phosphohydrolase
MQKVAFFSIFLIILGLIFLANRYVVNRASFALADTMYQSIFKKTYWVFPLLFFVGQFLERGEPYHVTKIISNIGSVWLGWFLYAFLIVVLVDVIRLVGNALNIAPKQVFTNYSNAFVLFSIFFVFLIALVTYGVINAYSPKMVRHQISVDKTLDKPLKIGLVTDLHMGAVRGKRSISKMVEMLNSGSPDIVLIAGDLVDHNPRFAIKDDLGILFEQIEAPLGIYAVTGNHEYIGDTEMSVNYLSKHGVNYLRDSVLNIDDQFVLVGREDREMGMRSGENRKEISELVNKLQDDTLPIILMDHQPVDYKNAVAHGVDLMLSGHTHKGQMWPNNWITNLVFENDYGLYQKGKTWFYTSNGYGTWGPPIRIGNTPEVVMITLQSK